MAHGPVTTPAGLYTPIERLNTSGTNEPNALPSNGPDHALGAGLQHFLFTGRLWPAHETKGIDWDLYLVPDGVERFYIGSWGHDRHSGRETGEYQRSNGTPFRESQYILRVLGTGSFSTVILPYRKGEAPTRTVTQQPCGVRISQGGETFCVGERSYQFSDGTRTVLTTFDAQSAGLNGVSIAGGPTEVVLTASEAKICASGAAGNRVITLPGSWVLPSGLTRNGTTYSFDYSGTAPVTFTLTK